MRWYLYILAVVAATLTACSSNPGDEPTPPPERKSNIAFAPMLHDASPEDAPAAPTALARDFYTYGYKNTPAGVQQVFMGYQMHYQEGTAGTSTENTHDYSYVGGTGIGGIKQEIKYWDFGASEYHLWACTNKDAFTGSPDGTKLTINNVRLTATEPDINTTTLYTQLYERKPVSNNVVQFAFKRPYAKVCVQFYTTEPMAEDEHYTLRNIHFAPDPASATRVYKSGNVSVTYPQSCTTGTKETVSLTVNEDGAWNQLAFLDVELNHLKGTASNNAVIALIPDKQVLELEDMPGIQLAPGKKRAGETPAVRDHYYVLPMGACASKKNPAFVMSLTVDGELKTAVVPAAYMQWMPNVHYTYLFKISELGTKIEFFDVKIEPWHYGGSQDDTWINW